MFTFCCLSSDLEARISDSVYIILQISLFASAYLPPLPESICSFPKAGSALRHDFLPIKNCWYFFPSSFHSSIRNSSESPHSMPISFEHCHLWSVRSRSIHWYPLRSGWQRQSRIRTSCRHNFLHDEEKSLWLYPLDAKSNLPKIHDTRLI